MEFYWWYVSWYDGREDKRVWKFNNKLWALMEVYGLNVSYVGNLPIPITNSSLNLFKLQNKKEQDDKKNINGSWQKITK